jgi:hypothetical protein
MSRMPLWMRYALLSGSILKKRASRSGEISAVMLAG